MPTTHDLIVELGRVIEAQGLGAEALRPYFDSTEIADDYQFRSMLLVDAACEAFSSWDKPELSVEFAQKLVQFWRLNDSHLPDKLLSSSAVEAASRLVSVGAYRAAVALIDAVRNFEAATEPLDEHALDDLYASAIQPDMVGSTTRAVRSRKVTKNDPRKPHTAADDQLPYYVIPVHALIERGRHAANRVNPYTRYISSLATDGPEYVKFNVSVPKKRNPSVLRSPNIKQLKSAEAAEYYLVRPINIEQDLFQDLETFCVSAATKERPVLLFVHGLDQSVTEAVLHLAQLVADAELNCDPVAFCWPSYSKFRYPTAVSMIDDGMRPTSVVLGLTDLIAKLSTKLYKSQPLWILGHSLGCRMILRALKQLLSQTVTCVNRLILASPDIPVADMALNAQTLASLPHAVVFGSSYDKALRVPETRIVPVHLRGPRVGRYPGSHNAGMVYMDTSDCQDSRKNRHSDFSECTSALTNLNLRLQHDGLTWRTPDMEMLERDVYRFLR
jgi:esterase/lipase superfamily enzyme